MKYLILTLSKYLILISTRVEFASVYVEGQGGVVSQHEVDPHHPGLDLVRNALGLGRIGRVHVRTESKRGVVGDAHGVGLVGGAEQHGDRPEEFLGVGIHLGGDVGEHCGREEVALALTAGEYRRTLRDRTVELLLQASGCCVRRERAEVGVVRGGVGRLHGREHISESGREVLVVVVRDPVGGVAWRQWPITAE